MKSVTMARANEVWALGKELSGGFGLWGTIDQLTSLDGFTEWKRLAVVEGWINGARSLGFTDTDAAALGDWRIGRHFVDTASFWNLDPPEVGRKKAQKAAVDAISYAVKDEGGIAEVKRQLVLNYTNYYPVSYANRLGRTPSVRRE